MLNECLALLAVQPGGFVIDGTVGDGGHAEAILKQSAPGGRLLGIDRDPEAVAFARQRLAPFGERVRVLQASFRDLARLCDEPPAKAGRASGVLLDLGVSSRQIDEPARGFRFAEADAEQTPLDMRMDPGSGQSAAELLAGIEERALATLLREFGEVPGAGKLARAICRARREAPLQSAADLRRVLNETATGRGRRHDPATLVFQALRIAVNDELGALDEGLAAALEVLAPGGRICVLAYHSLEDRRVKSCFAREERGCLCPPRQPLCNCGRRPRLKRLNPRPLRPGADEIARNPRARSARLRAAEKLAEAA